MFEEPKSAGKALFLKLLGLRESWWAGRVKTVISSSHFIALTKQCANHGHPLSFPLFFVNMKGLVPTATSNVAAAGPIPGHGVSQSPSPPHINPQLTKAALGGIIRRTAPFNYVWHSLSSCVVCWHCGLCARSWPDSPDDPSPRWTLAAEGRIKALRVPWVNSQGVCTHTHILPLHKGNFPYAASSRHSVVSCMSRGRHAD